MQKILWYLNKLLKILLASIRLFIYCLIHPKQSYVFVVPHVAIIH